jgi:hypothetical protein
MKTSHRIAALAIAAAALGSAIAAFADTESVDGPRFTDDGRLLRPENYREWINIGTGLNMAYGPVRERLRDAPHPPFTNVFVNPTSYRAFLSSGIWPDKTLFILEIRASAPVNKTDDGGNGYFQGEVIALEAEVKDEKRFARKWGFFDLPLSAASGALLPASASCYSCHENNGAVDNTFVQFYPVLRDVAKAKGTMKKVPEVF